MSSFTEDATKNALYRITPYHICMTLSTIKTNLNGTLDRKWILTSTGTSWDFCIIPVLYPRSTIFHDSAACKSWVLPHGHWVRGVLRWWRLLLLRWPRIAIDGTQTHTDTQTYGIFYERRTLMKGNGTKSFQHAYPKSAFRDKKHIRNLVAITLLNNV